LEHGIYKTNKHLGRRKIKEEEEAGRHCQDISFCGSGSVDQ
jgi:hypothetical protein